MSKCITHHNSCNCHMRIYKELAQAAHEVNNTHPNNIINMEKAFMRLRKILSHQLVIELLENK